MDNMTVRKNLGKKKSRTWIDMEKVYRMIDSGMTVTQAAESLLSLIHISEPTRP